MAILTAICIADLRSSNLPIILDSGSTAQKNGATWNMIDITPQGCDVEVFKNSRSDSNIVWNSISKSNLSGDCVEKPWYQDGLRFKCTGCGQCCTGSPGYVWVSPEEAEAMAKHLKIPLERIR